MRTEQEQVNEMIAIVRKDAKGTGKLIDEDGNTCALGALMQAAGVEDLRRAGYRNRKLLSYFPILRGHTDEVWVTNDCNDSLANRRKELVKLFKSWIPE